MLYFALTGVHLFHVLIGLLVLAALARELRDPSRCRPAKVEAGALYWHMVDLVWVVMFALLYLIR
jgi:nitric oxide reductase NorE protein